MMGRAVENERRDGAMVGRAVETERRMVAMADGTTAETGRAVETASHRERGRKEAAPVSTAFLDGANLLALEYLLDFVELVERLGKGRLPMWSPRGSLQQPICQDRERRLRLSAHGVWLREGR